MKKNSDFFVENRQRIYEKMGDRINLEMNKVSCKRMSRSLGNQRNTKYNKSGGIILCLSY